MTDTPERFLRMRDVLQATGLGRSTIYREINAGKFPKPVSLCEGRVAVWVNSEVQQWVREKIAVCR